MRKFRESEDRRQQNLLPRSVEEFVPKEDLARYVDSLVEELDLTAIEEEYSSEGRPGFRPDIMVKLLVYGKMRGIRSSRQLADSCRENLKFIYVTSGEQPDFRTISLFRQRFCTELAGILQQTINIGLESGVIDLEHVAIDGTLVKSFAGENSYKTPERIAEELKLLEKALEADIEKEESSDDDTPKGGGSLPKELQDPKRLKEKLQAALKKHGEYSGRPKAEQPKKVSVTDPDCRYTRKGPAYNGQAAVDEKSRMVVAGFACNAAADSAQLVPLLEEIEKNTKSNPKKATADAGYNARIALQKMKERSIEGYVPQRRDAPTGYPLEKFLYQSKTDTYVCPEGKVLKCTSRSDKSTTYAASLKDCRECSKKSECMRFTKTVSPRSLRISAYSELIKEMNERVKSQKGREMAKKRSSTVETLFAHLKYARKLRRFIFRGMSMVNSIWKFELAVYNLERIIYFKRMGVI